MDSSTRITEGLYQAALVSNNPQSSPDQIAQAVQFVEQVKLQEVHTVLQAASQLAQPQQPLEVQVVGMSLLHQQAQGRWKQMSPEAQSTLASIAHAAFTQVATGGAAWVLKGKAAQLLASVTTHQGPEPLGSLTNQMLALGAQADAAQVELACLVLRYISEDVTHFEELDGVDRKPLLAAVMASSPYVLLFAAQVLQHHWTRGSQLRAAGELSAAQQSAGAVSGAFGLVSSCMEWAPIKAIASSGLVGAMMWFMDSDEYRMAAMDVLKQITSRRQVTESEEVYVPFMGEVAAALVTMSAAVLKPEYLASLGFAGPLEDFGIRLCSTMATFAEMHFRCVTKPEDKLLFIRQMLKFVEHPFLFLAAEAIQFWQYYLQKLVPPQHGTPANPAKAAAAAAGADNAAKPASTKAAPPPKPAYLAVYDPPDDVWNELAFAMTGHMQRVVLVPDIEVEPPEYFETPQEHREFCAKFRGQVKVVMRLTATRAPEPALQCTTQFLHFCLERAGTQQPKPQLLAHLEAAVFCLEAVIGAVVEHADHAQLLPNISQLLQTLMQYRNPMPAAILLQVRGLEAFAKPLEYLPHLALPLLETGLYLLQSIPLGQHGHLPPPPDMSPDAKEAAMARLVCAKLLLGLSRDAATALAPHLQSIAQRTEALWQEGKLQEGERVQLCEGLLCASAALGTESQAQVLEWMLKPVHSLWSAPAWQAHIASPQEFVNSFLPWKIDAAGKPAIDGRDARWSLYHQFALVERAMRRSPEGPLLDDGRTTPPPHPWNAHLEWVLIPVLQLITCLHGLWTPDMRGRLGPIVGVLDMAPREKAVRLKADMAEAKKDEDTAGIAGAGEGAVRTWLQGMRDMCYMVVFGASYHCPAFWLNAAVAAAAPALLSHLQSIEHRHLRTLLRHVVSVWAARCPVSLRPQWLGPLLSSLIPHMLERLNQAWGQLASATAAPSESEQQLSQERLEDSVLRDVNKEYMEVLLCIVKLRDTAEAERNSAAQENSSCLDFLLETNPRLALTTLATATATLEWPDAEAAKRALVFIRLAVPKFGLRVAGVDVVAGAALRSVIAALAAPLFLTLQADLLSVARVLCLTYLQHTQHVRQQLQMLPKMTPQAFANFESAFFSTQVEKVQRDMVKAVLLEAGDESLRALLLLHGQPTVVKPAATQQKVEEASNGRADMFS